MLIWGCILYTPGRNMNNFEISWLFSKTTCLGGRKALE